MKILTNNTASPLDLQIKKPPQFTYKVSVGAGASIEVPDEVYTIIESSIDPLQWTTQEQADIIKDEIVSTLAPATKGLYVDKTRIDPYVEEGSILKPFKTIMAAIAKIIANADNAIYPYVIHIIGSATYTENLQINSALLKNISFQGYDGVTINPASGYALDSSLNNTALVKLYFRGITFSKPINFIGSDDAGSMFSDGCYFTDCKINAVCYFENFLTLNFHNCQITSNIDVENVTNLICNASYLSGGAVTLVWIVANNKPLGATNTIIKLLGCDTSSSMSIGADCYAYLDVCKAGGTYVINGNLIASSCWIYAALNVNVGGTFVNNGSFYSPALLTLSGTLVNNTSAGVFKIYNSGEKVGTGTPQSWTHGLGYTPSNVFVCVTNTTSGTYVVTEGAHDTASIVLTVTSGIRYKTLAF